MQMQPDVKDEFPLRLRGDDELLEFSLMCATLCAHCSARAQLALFGSKIFCGICLEESKDERYADSRYILSYAIELMMATDEEMEKANAAAGSDAEAGNPDAHPSFRKNDAGKMERVH